MQKTNIILKEYKYMQRDFVIMLAWPEGYVEAAGAWYDKIFSNKGKYRVGHSAIILVENKTNKACYFDFGRYHTPVGFGRVRDEETDPDLKLPRTQTNQSTIININELLKFIFKLKSTHGKGKLYAAVISKVNFKKAYDYAKSIQDKGMLKYGPFVQGGTNCSRFTSSVAIQSNPPLIKRLRFIFPFCISPSPKRNVSISNNSYYVVDKDNIEKISKSKLKSYFSSIEI